MTVIQLQQNVVEFKLLKEKDEIPYNLLLLADETIEAINKYIFKSDIYLASIGKEVIGVFCLYEIDNKTIELKNIAVDEKFQSKGYGSLLIDFMKQICKEKYEILIVGTPDTGTRQIRFYENNGFTKFDVRKDFFINNYEKPIIENGVQLKDMVLLKFQL